MASCVLCAQLAHVYCTADAAFLCFDCDKTIHSANVISRGHKRLPVCELCKRSAASVYCQEDAASLCSRCDGEVHNANPLPHTTTPIERAMETGLVRSAGLPYVPSAGSGSQPAPCCAPAPAPVAAEDEVSGVFGGQGASEMPSLNLHSPSDGNTSLAVVPDFMGGAHLHAPPAGTAGPSTVGKGKEDDLDLLDFEAAWLSNMDMGLDLAEFLGFGHDTALDVPGMVPSVPEPVTAAPAMPTAPALPVSVPAPVQPLPQPQPQHDDTDILNGVLDHDDFVVPSFLPDELSDDEAHPALTMAHQAEALTGKKRSAAIAALPALDTFQAQLPMAVPPQAAVPHMVIAPPPPALDSPSLPPAANVHQSARLAAASAASPTYLNGANLTREQRVARYREKRKNRTFQKTIRYASRKAYAEVRPRIKGRFATKEEVAAFKAAQAAGLLAPDAEFTLV